MSDTPHMVGHVHLKVRDLATAVDFYAELLGLSVTERHDSYAFLSWGDRHHDVALQAVGPSASDPPAAAVGLYHAAFEVDDPATLRRIHTALEEAGHAVTAVDHGISKALYFDDPSGNGLEVYLDTRDEGETTWQGRSTPFDPQAL